MTKYRIPILIFTAMLVLSACNMPSSQPTEQVNPNAVFTAAAQTVEVQLTQNALLNPTSPPATIAPPTITSSAATNTPLPPVILSTATSSPGGVVIPTSTCDAAQFVTDVTIPDGTPIVAGTTFTKTWRLKNIGTCSWTSAYSLVFDSGDAMGGPASQPLAGSVAPGESVDISVNLQAPTADGTYRGYWGLKNAAGTRLPVSSGKTFFVEIKVGTGSSSATDSPGKFAVTSVGFDVARTGTCASMTYNITASITTNKAGDVTYTWIRSDGATGPSNSGTLTFDSASSKTITFAWQFGGGNQWVDLYIDNPNHQQFGRATLNCP